MALFPSKYIHVGGDEVSKTQWKESPQVQARMKQLGIKEPAALQVYFTQRMARFLKKNGRKLVGWDEILEPGLPDGSVVMSWRGLEGAFNAASRASIPFFLRGRRCISTIVKVPPPINRPVAGA